MSKLSNCLRRAGGSCVFVDNYGFFILTTPRQKVRIKDMARQIRINAVKRKKTAPQELAFTVIYLPVGERDGRSVGGAELTKQGPASGKNPEPVTGYQVTVPLLPGLVTYGRTLEEAEEMTRDAIECHIEGLRKSGEPIPNERFAHKGKLRIALSV